MKRWWWSAQGGAQRPPTSLSSSVALATDDGKCLTFPCFISAGLPVLLLPPAGPEPPPATVEVAIFTPVWAHRASRCSMGGKWIHFHNRFLLTLITWHFKYTKCFGCRMCRRCCTRDVDKLKMTVQAWMSFVEVSGPLKPVPRKRLLKAGYDYDELWPSAWWKGHGEGFQLGTSPFPVLTLCPLIL